MISRVFRSVGAGGLAALAAAAMLAAAQPASARDGQSGWEPFRNVRASGDHRLDPGEQYAWWFDRDRHRSDWRRDRDRRRDWNRGDRRRDRDWGSRYKGEDHRRNGWINPSGGGGL